MVQKNPFEIVGQSHSEKDYRRAIDERSLLEAEFNVSSSCNLDCPFCYTDANKENSKLISLDDIDLFLKQVSEAGAKTVRIVGDGEPFVDKRIFDGTNFPFFELAQKYGITTVVYTNGTLIDEDLARQLYDYDISLVTKQYSFSPDVFEEMTGNKGFFTSDKQVRLSGNRFIPKGLEILMNQGFNDSDPTRLGVNNVLTSQNIGELNDLYQFARLNNLSVRSGAFLHGLRDFDKTVSLGDIEQRYEELAKWEKDFSGFSWKSYGELLGGECSRLGFNITLDGDRYKLCAGDNSYLKDEKGEVLTLYNSSIKDIVENGSFFEKIRSARREGRKFRCIMSEDLGHQVGDRND